ncbi:hypothetical protein AKJ51_04225 [candidate division MSBL1 archaeon SCGC-AAA382A20]|uniref:Uncharacterized protein n=1 Tax=candidate division MSBL1 archaeon SCGC-AAA382A20 TaxID=1698280 RepID=A0A133VI45_9EURY|nr:hypothetical protein AKJ51_04225 [candidate division MSBL1 archaeon SCGC-AAA382A20]
MNNMKIEMDLDLEEWFDEPKIARFVLTELNESPKTWKELYEEARTHVVPFRDRGYLSILEPGSKGRAEINSVISTLLEIGLVNWFVIGDWEEEDSHTYELTLLGERIVSKHSDGILIEILPINEVD